MREMKESNERWIGRIPCHWQMQPIKYQFDLVAGATPLSSVEAFWDGSVVWITPADYKTSDKYVSKGKRNITKQGYNSCSASKIPSGSLIFSKRAPIGTVAINTVPLCTNQGCISCVAKKKNVIDYFYYVLSIATEELNLRGSGTAFKEISAAAFGNVKLPVPTKDEQKRIAAYLDIKCAKIAEVANDIQVQIDILEQYKRSVITEAVTKGMNPDAEMKDSGVQWIGHIPAHWECKRGKYILKYIQRPVREDDGVITCFRDGEVTLRSNRREDGFTMSDKEIGYQGIEAGDLVVHGMDGFAGAIGISDSRGKASPVLNVLNTEQNKKYIMYYLRSMAYSNVFAALATGIRVRSCDLRWNKLAELSYPIPPVEEQNDIVEHIDEVLEKTDAVIAEKKAQLEILERYKKSFIYEHVTGKKEVPPQ